MTKTEYKSYLQSSEWQEKRLEAIAYGGDACARCEMPRWLAEIAYDQDLHVHHLTYANRGNESMDDLEVLCRRCHEVETFGRSELGEPKRAHCEACGDTHWNYRSNHCTVCASLRFYPRGFFHRLQQPDMTKEGQPYWMTILEHLAIDVVIDGASPDEIKDSFGNLLLAYAQRYLREQREDLPF